MSQSGQFSSLIQSFFAQHLCEHKQVSPRTVTVYRDTFRLLFAFMQTRTGRTPSELGLANLDAPVILEFLENLETARHNNARSRNLRLSAIRSFFRYASVRDVEHLAVANRVLAIPTKRTSRPLLTFLSRPEMDAILASMDQKTWLGGRDHALLLTMYNTGARASEITALTLGQVVFGSTTLVHLHGKGRKERTVPLWPQTAKVLTRWFQILNTDEKGWAFPTMHGTRLSADALNRLLQGAVGKALTACPDLASKRVTPHVIRHTTALHLLQAGVDIAVIALWLGHESIETTHGYVEADIEMKQRALEKLTPASYGQPLQGGRFSAAVLVEPLNTRSPAGTLPIPVPAGTAEAFPARLWKPDDAPGYAEWLGKLFRLPPGCSTGWYHPLPRTVGRIIPTVGIL